MNPTFEKNIAALKLRTPEWPSILPVLADHIKALSAATGEITIRFNNILIHSAYDPAQEALNFARKIEPGSRVCLYGFGLGYHVQSVLDRVGPEGFLLVIELNASLLSAAMLLKDQTKLLSHKNLHLIFGTEQSEVAREISIQMQKMEGTAVSPVEVLFHNPSFKCIPGNFPALANALEVLLMERRFPGVLGDLEKQNYEFNIDIVKQSRGINALKGKHQGQPGVLVSAGPSLDDLLPHLGRIADPAVISCVDTSLPVLTREGILPQYVFTLDPQEESFHYFRENLESAFKLIYTPTAHAKVVSFFRGEKFVVFKKGHSLYQNLDAVLEEKGTTLTGGSVSCLGLDCLMQFGCSPIFLIGQDCAYSGNRNYCRGSDMNQKLLDRIHRGHTLANAHSQKTLAKKPIRVEGAFGETVLTSQSMFSYKRNLEQIALQRPEVPIFNLCSHGAELENTTPLGSVNEMMLKLRGAHPGNPS